MYQNTKKKSSQYGVLCGSFGQATYLI